ncbi:MAG: STAS domain-containing protein [Phycisphaerae bacterium]|nr:STAS domain-containing protein [Phycisphaerae bacterium]
MAIQEWSDSITVVELGNDPEFSDDLDGLVEAFDDNARDVALNFAAVGFINSSNVSQLLRLRKHVLAGQKRLILCSVNAQVWGVFQVTGLDKIFEFTNDISTALAALQLTAIDGE